MAAQLPDWIIINGEFKDLYSNPLEPFWTELGKKRPDFFPKEYCVRGYIATWQLMDNQLFLIGVDGDYEKHSVLFGNKSLPFTLTTFMPHGDGKPVKASWFSGKLRVPDGKMMYYEDQGYDSRFEKEIIITLYKGDLDKDGDAGLYSQNTNS